MPRDPGTGAKSTAHKKPKQPFLDAIGHPQIRPGSAHVISAPRGNALAQAQQAVVRHQLDPEVVSRQRLLRAHGYGVIVDGVWGPRSASAWADYSSKLQRPKLAPGPAARPPAPPTVADARRETLGLHEAAVAQAREHAQAQVNLLAAQRQLAKMHGEHLHSPLVRQRIGKLQHQVAGTFSGPAQLAISQEVRRTVDFAAKARSKPAEKMTTSELVATTVDPITGKLDPGNPGEVRRVQRWLTAHGHRVNVDGVWGSQTNEALVTALKAYDRQQRVAQVDTLVNRFYKTGVVIPGAPLGPLLHAPRPGELLDILQGKGNPFSGAILWREMNRRLELADPAYTHFVESQLAQIENELHGPFVTPSFIKRTVQSRYVDLTVGAETAMGNRAASLFSDQLNALVSARDGNDLRRRLTLLQSQAEAEAAAHAKSKMGDKGAVDDVWGATKAVFGALSRPAEVVANGLETAGAALTNDVEAAWRILTSGGQDTTGAQHALGRDPQAQARQFAEEHPWIDLGIQVIADPLWLVDPVQLVAAPLVRMGAVGVARLDRLGYALADGNQLQRIVSPALMAPASQIQHFQIIGRSMRELGLGGKLLSHKQVALATVRNRVRAMRRRNFADLDTGRLVLKSKLGQVQHDLQESLAEFTTHVETVSGPVVKQLHRSGGVIFSELGADIDSVVGGQIRARVTASAVVHLLQDYAIEEGHLARVSHKYGSTELGELLRRHKLSAAAFDGVVTGRIVDREGTGELDDLFSRVADVREEYGLPLSAVAEDADSLAAGQAASREAFRRATSHLVAGGDAEIEQALGWRITQVHDDVGDTLAAIQLRLEQLADARAEQLKLQLAETTDPAARAAIQAEIDSLALYDDAGKWIGRGGELTDLARSVGRSAFSHSKPIANAAFGHAHTADEMLALRNAEIGRRFRDIDSNQARLAAEGAGRPAAAVDALKQAVLDEVNTAWHEQPGIGFFDRRPTIERSTMYLRHLADALRDNNLADLTDLSDVVTAAHVGGEPTPFESGLDNLGFVLARSRTPSGFDLALLQGQTEFVVRSADRDGQLQLAGMDLRRSLEVHSTNLDLAQAYAIPKEMMREWAVWEALSKAQTMPLQKLYVGLSGFLDAWLLATLPLRPGFLVRNVIDNTSKMLAAGALDPRYYFLGASKPGENLGRALSIFDLGIQQMRYVLSLGGRFQANPALHYFDRLLDTFWQHNTDVIRRVFAAHQIDVPESAIKAMQHQLPQTADTVVKRWRQKVWHLMANVPENYAKRALYRATYAKAIRDGATEIEAFQTALDKIEFTLFDYSKVSVLEDNLRVVFPFLQYWRRTANFWVTTAVHKPALPLALQQFEEHRNDANADLPSWMRRYVNIEPVTNVLARVPGLEWLMPGLQDGLQTDPINLFSFGVLYRAFKNENPELPPDKAGWAFLAPFADAVNTVGISFNPLVRKPLELAGVFNFRAWQSVFPETGVAEALTRRFLSGRFQGFNAEAWLEDKVLQMIGDGPFVQQRIADGFNQWVQLEMAAQAERGERVNRARATQKIQDYYITQTLLSFFGGLWARRRDVSDVYLYNIAEQLHSDPAAFNKLSEKDQHAYRIFAKRKLDYLAFDRYLQTLPAIEGYYRLHGDWDAMQEYRKRHPEVSPYVSPALKGRPFGGGFIKDAPLLVDTDAAFRLFKLADQIDVDHETRSLAEAALVTPELRAFWAANDTPRQIRDKMLKGAFTREMHRLNDTYFAIPEKDYDARSGFLKHHPILAHWWNLNNDRADDLKAILNSTNATLRDHYFNLLDRRDYGSARDFLHRFPFIFEFTSAADRVDASGNWIGGAGHRRMTQHARDYLSAKAALDFFFRLLKNNAAHAWSWLRGDSDLAGAVRDYFRKYAHHAGPSQHALDYSAAKAALDHYFELKKRDPEAARVWLRSADRDAVKVRAYFKKYGHLTKTARKWKDPIHSDDPEINRRLLFWQNYWTLPPDSRPDFIQQHAQADGIFVYGAFGEQERARELREYLREAHAHHLTIKAALYLRIRPLLDVYFDIDDFGDKALFLRANPDVQDYLDSYAAKPHTGDEDLDGLIERYFKLPRYGSGRAALLHANPTLKSYFDEHSSAADRAIHDLLDVYFALPHTGHVRRDYSAQHPEIQAYFDKRRQERDLQLGQAMAFDLADPRLQGLLGDAWHNSAESAQRVQDSLRRSVADNKYGDQIVVRR